MTLSWLAAAREVPDRIALVVDGVPHTYAALAPAVERAMGWLVARGAGSPSGLRVALVAQPELDTLLAFHALVELGVPAVLLHPRLTAAEVRDQIDRAEPCLFVSEEETHAATRAQSGCELASRAPPVDDDRCLAVLFTSGTTGTPRGVLLSRAAFAAAAAASEANLGWLDEDRWLLGLSFAHVGGLTILLRALTGRRTVVVTTAAGGPSAASFPEALARVVSRDRVTLLSLVPTQLERLLDLSPPWRAPDHLRAVLVGGAAAPAQLINRALARKLPVLSTYGMTETCAQIATQRPGSDCVEAGVAPPLVGVELRITGGVIEVRAPSLLTGYLGSDSSPLTHDGWFRTLDLGFLDERGDLHVLGRADDMVISGGENVHPAEVEAALESCPGVAAACVFGVADARWGQIVCVAVVARDESPPTDEELVAHLGERLAGFKRPRLLAWVESLPLSAGGKLARRQIAASSEVLPRLRPLRSG